MAVTDLKMHPNGKATVKTIHVPFTSATGQTDKVVRRIKPGYRFEVVEVQVDVDTVTATISANAKIGSTSVLASAITPVAATPTNGTMATSRSARRGSATSVLSLMYTSNGSGAVTNGAFLVTIRPYPLNGEV